MTYSDVSLIVSLASIVAVIVLLARYYQAQIEEARERIDEVRAEANFWRRKAEALDKPVA